MSIGQIMAECDCQHTACDLRGYCMATRIAELEAEVARLREAGERLADLWDKGLPDRIGPAVRQMRADLDKDRAP